METDNRRQGVNFTKVGSHKNTPYKTQTNSPNVHNFSKSKPITLKYIVLLADGGQGFGCMFFETRVKF